EISIQIFAPSNQAFENVGKLSDVAIDNLLKRGNFNISNGNGKVGKVISAGNVASNKSSMQVIIELPNSPTNVMDQRKDINDFEKLITAANLGNLFDIDRSYNICTISVGKIGFSGVLLEGASDNLKSYEGSTRGFVENTTTYNDGNILQIPSDNNKDKNYSGVTQNNRHGNAIKDVSNIKALMMKYGCEKLR
ncbi:15774_t:CDS:2, partial [Funneliformis geosporum]